MKALALAFWLWQADPAALSDQAQQAAIAGRLDEAERLWKQSLQGAPGYFPALFNLGFLYFNGGRFGEAEPLLRRAARANPKDFNTQYILGNTLLQMGKREEALRAWRGALAIRPDQLRLMKVMAVEYSKGRYFAEAAALARRSAELAPQDADAAVLAVQALTDTGDLKAATVLAREAAARFPGVARVQFEYASLLHRQGRWEQAGPLLEAAMRSDASYEEPWYLYGDVLAKQEQAEKSIPYFERAIALRSDYLPARMALARAYVTLSKWEAAKQQVEEAIRIKPEDPQPYLLLSQIHFRLGDEAAAKAAREKSLAVRRANPVAQEAAISRPFPK